MGSEFQVNPTASSSFVPSIAALPDGGFVVAWQDGETGSAIQLAKFSADGQRTASRVIATNAAAKQTSPSVAALDTGGFVVAWNSPGNIKSHAYDNSLSAVGSEFTIDLPDYLPEGTPPPGSRPEYYREKFLADESPEVADLAGPGYVLGWSLEDRTVTNQGGFGAYSKDGFKPQVQIVADNGTPRGLVIDIDVFLSGNKGWVDVAGLSTGDFVVSYVSLMSSSGGEYYTRTQICNASGGVVRARLGQDVGRIAALTSFASGGFALTGSPTYEYSGRPFSTIVYGNDGNVLGNGDGIGTVTNDIALNTIAIAGSRTGYALSAAAVRSNSAGADDDIRAVLFNPAGTATSAPITVNSVTAGQATPDVAFLADGAHAVIVWRDGGTGNIKAVLVSFTSAL